MLTLVSLTGACVSSTDPDGNDSRYAPSPINSGTLATSYPEAVLVDIDPGQATGGDRADRCAGVVIAPRVVLTAGHCVAGNGWAVTAPYANNQQSRGTRATTFDYDTRSDGLDPNHHDVGIIFLDTPIRLNIYPTLATSGVANNTQVVNIGRTVNGVLSSTDLYVSPPAAVLDGASQGFNYSYTSRGITFEQGDSGGPDMLTTSHTIVAVNSGLDSGHEIMARVDLVAGWIEQQIAAASSGGQGGTPQGGGQCIDTSQNCAYWASTGECQNNPAYMLTSCCASCKTGSSGNRCVDTDQNCAYWASTGECQNNPAYMLTSCCASCRAGGG